MKYYTKKQIFYVNSARRLGGISSNFHYYLNIDPTEQYDRVVVLAASIPKSYYLIDSSHNQFSLKEDVSQITITFPTGNYTRRSLATTLTTLLNDNSPNGYTYAITYTNIGSGNDDGKYVFTVTGNGGVQPEFNFTDQMYEQLGFEINSTNTFVGDTLTSTNVINLTNEATLFIHSDICQNSEGDDVLQDIYTVGDSSYSMINFENKTPMEYGKEMVLSQKNIYHFNVSDENGRVIDTNGINVNFTLMVYKNNDNDRLIKGAIKLFTMFSGKILNSKIMKE